MANMQAQNNWYQIIVVLMLATGAYLVDLPLNSDRPIPSGAGIKAQGMQNVDARLWQDPVAAVQTASQKAERYCISVADRKAVLEPCNQQAAKRDLSWLNQQINDRSTVDNTPQRIDMLVAMLPGGNWVDADEARRRIRFATLAGLKVHGYVPEDPDHIGYVQHVMHDQKLLIPFEWFTQEDDAGHATHRLALLVWLDEETLLREMPGKQRPLQALQRLDEILNRLNAIKEAHLAVLGPYTSTFLDTLQPCIDEAKPNALCKKFDTRRWYSPYATKNLMKAGQAKPHLFKRFHQTIINDGRLAQGLAQELQRRRFGDGSTIALIGQWDTTYARALRNDIRATLSGPLGFHGDFVQASYLRGIDGLTPDQKDKPDAKKDDKKEIEHPEGDGQIDYLRRIAIDLKQHEQTSQHRIGAIGVFGNDFHDKLLVLKALRPEFPTAVFFTTDLNAGMLYPTDNKYTRNLVVASGYHLRLGDGLQKDIPPFRDSYQTSGFLATQAALYDLTHDQAPTWLDQALATHIFEIGRTQAISLLSDPPNGASGLKPCTSLDDVDCSPHPTDASPPDWKKALLAPLCVALLALVLIAAGRLERGDWGRWLTLFVLTGLLSAAFIAFLRHNPTEREPFSWLQGVSIWPSEMLRLVAFGLAAWLIRRGNRFLKETAEVISAKYFLLSDTPPQTGPLKQARDLWLAYCHRGRTRPRPLYLAAWLRALLMLGVLILLFLLIKAGQPAGIPVPLRGEPEFWIDKVILALSMATFLALTLRTFEVALHGIWLARELRGPTCWPSKLLDRYWPQSPPDCTQQNLRALDGWLDAHLIAEATKPLQKMLFYPFAVIAVLIIARAPLFDAWFYPTGMIVGLCLIILILVALALRLRYEAERVRENALQDMNDLQVELQAQGQDAMLKQINLLASQVRELHVGAFAPFTQQPLIKSALTIGASLSGLALLDYASIMNF